MNKTELIAKVAETAGMSKVDSKKAIDAAIVAVKDALKAGEKVQIPGIITLSVVERAARNAKSPRTGEVIAVPAKKVVKAKVGAELEAAI